MAAGTASCLGLGAGPRSPARLAVHDPAAIPDHQDNTISEQKNGHWFTEVTRNNYHQVFFLFIPIAGTSFMSEHIINSCPSLFYPQFISTSAPLVDPLFANLPNMRGKKTW